MGAQLKTGSVQKKLEKLARRFDTEAKEVEIGVTDATVAPYATYDEFGWVQRVTKKQAKWFIQQGVSKPPKEGSSLVNPPRPFLRGTLAAEGGKWRKTLGTALKRSMSPTKALTIVGIEASQDVREAIRTGGTKDGKFPDRAEMTMELIKPAKEKQRKGKNRSSTATATSKQPLVLTGKLLNSISFEVK